MWSAVACALGFLAMMATAQDNGQMRSELIFAPERLHNHGSCVVECPNGDLLACWYRGSGERTADDVAIMGARLRKGSGRWSKPFLMADTPGLPDTNPCMVVDPRQRLWLLWPVIQDNQWSSALMKLRVSRNFRKPGSPVWEQSEVLHVKPGPEFGDDVRAKLPAVWSGKMPRARMEELLVERTKALDDKLACRLGWMTRAHPFVLDGTRMIVPLYSDFWDVCLMAITDDWGRTWHVSRPVIGAAAVQPSLACRKDGTLVAYFRDNGPPPQRVAMSTSNDRGETWSDVTDTELMDPGAGVDVLVLRSRRWLLVHNDAEDGRYRLAVSISEDEGRTWPRQVYLERDERGPGAGSYSYPSVIQTADGRVHVTYSFRAGTVAAGQVGEGESIKHVSFTEEWLERAAGPAAK